MKRIALGPYLFLFLVVLMIVGLAWFALYPLYFSLLFLVFITFLILNAKRPEERGNR